MSPAARPAAVSALARRRAPIAKPDGRSSALVLSFTEVDARDGALVGGKNSSLGEMIRYLQVLKINVPAGFATTAHAYWHFIDENKLRPRLLQALARLEADPHALPEVGRSIRALILGARMPDRLRHDILKHYDLLCRDAGMARLDVAVRSSATAEDLPTASFAGQLESFLNIHGRDRLVATVQRCFASLFTDRAISYRTARGYDHMAVALSVGVQRMVHSDQAGAGVTFSIDTETGFPETVLINAAWGLGEYVVKGIVNPDEYVVFKPLLGKKNAIPIIGKTLGSKERKLVYASGKAATRGAKTSTAERTGFVLAQNEILTLARWAVAIEKHYGVPMDIEWAKDADSGKLFIVQARPETVESRREAGVLKTYTLKRRTKPLVSGLAIGSAIATGKVCRLKSARDAGKFVDGGILVTELTDPDWGPIMKRAAAIVTSHGGRTSHAAIVSREIGLPAVVGAAGATRLLQDGEMVTVSCAEGDQGFVYSGQLAFEEKQISVGRIARTRTRIMLNMADPAGALRWWRLPADGIGLARMEFIVSNHIRIHPMALAHFDAVRDASARRAIEALTRGYPDKPAYFIDRLAQGVARLAASQYPKPVILRLSDFKTNEYAKLIGGAGFEPQEPNPMIGWRGASRYYSAGYRDGFALECQAIRKVRDEMGLTNLVAMIPFCRTLAEADLVLREMGKHGLKRGYRGLEVYVMCEIPSNVILAKEFAQRFDGFSIGSNDLTQLTLGVDRDSDLIAHLFNEDDPAVTTLIRTLIKTAHRAGAHVGLCGQAPSDRPDYARFLVEAGIDSISVTPDSFLAVKANVGAAEKTKFRRKS
jgi:pyruvate, water dikinase